MRKLETKDEGERRRKRNQWIIGIVLVVVMLFSTLGYAFQGKDETKQETNSIDYRGEKFLLQNGLWTIQRGDFLFSFTSLPEDANLSKGLDKLSSYAGAPLYVFSENFDAEYEIYRNLDQVVLRRQRACLDGTNCDETLPIKTCEDNFVIIRVNETESVIQQDSCVFISGPQDLIVKLTDEFLLETIGIF